MSPKSAKNSSKTPNSSPMSTKKSSSTSGSARPGTTWIKNSKSEIKTKNKLTFSKNNQTKKIPNSNKINRPKPKEHWQIKASPH